MAVYITFGQIHKHSIAHYELDKDAVAKVRDRDHAFRLFGDEFFTDYSLGQIEECIDLFPRGVIDLTSFEPCPAPMPKENRQL